MKRYTRLQYTAVYVLITASIMAGYIGFTAGNSTLLVSMVWLLSAALFIAVTWNIFREYDIVRDLRGDGKR